MEHLLQYSPEHTQQILKQPSQKVPSQNLQRSSTMFKDEQDLHGSVTLEKAAGCCPSVGDDIWPLAVNIVCEYLG